MFYKYQLLPIQVMRGHASDIYCSQLFCYSRLTYYSSISLSIFPISFPLSIYFTILHSHFSFFTILPYHLAPTVLSTIAVAISPDGETVATSHGDHTIKIFKFYTGSYCPYFFVYLAYFQFENLRNAPYYANLPMKIERFVL